MVKIDSLELKAFPLLLAPMEDISDQPFRLICKQHGADIVYTEFISSEGLIRNAIKSTKKLVIDVQERPIGIQIFGSGTGAMIESAKLVEKVKPNLLDINFGCSVKKVVSKGCGAALLKDIPKMMKLTESIVKMVNIPVTVKTRLGWDENTKDIVEITERLQDIGIKAITIHGRTAKQLFKGTADWTLIGAVKNNPRIKIPVFGNGDVSSPKDALEKRERYGVDGIMIGRAAIGNPWIFNEIHHYLNTGELLDTPELDTRIDVCRMHLQRSVAWKGPRTGLLEMRKHYTNYFKKLPHIKSFRTRLVTANSIEEIHEILDEILLVYKPIYESVIK